MLISRSCEPDQHAELFRALLQGSHPFNARTRRLGVISVYGDLSGTRRTKVLCAAIYMGGEDQWTAANKKWGKALKAARATYFHATEFFANPPQGEFAGWKLNSKRHREAEEAFTTAADSSGLVGYAFGMATAGLSAVAAATAKAQRTGPHVLRTARLICADKCLAWVARFSFDYPLPPGERIAVWFEDEQGIGEVIDYFNFMKKRRVAWTRSIVSVSSVEKRALYAPQMADLLAHLAWKHLGARQDFPIEPNDAFKRLLAGDAIQVHLMREQDAHASIAGIERFLAEHPRGYVTPARPR